MTLNILYAELGYMHFMNPVDAPKSIFYDKGIIYNALDSIWQKLNEE